ncbi:hypothetical protein AYO20_00729 [Fonsecaea nubica]|uniref:Methyltransferase domain-containing protein n=1 Tax=Fonsecaea nubica TaxID=856822 RepID=A0A178DDR2_9EURO|nr:hypothetical protein AYO20_00729 [Fonsecaea nubica]OAL39817.1 hypothetical protein AYO20_00729 [Fonsecaea nubica]
MTSSISEIQTRQPNLVIEVDEVDSALGGDLSTYTRSLRSSIFQGVQENGRAYHRYKDGSYILPQDDLEQERLDLQHEIFLVAFHRKLFLAPIQRSMQEVLDLGTGTGIWAIGFADQHPESNVLGIDLSPIQPHAVPPNCKFEVDDFEARWTFKKKFDFIHGRMLLTSCSDFPRLFRRAFDALQPGGWLEMQDLYMPLLCDDGTLEGTAYGEWNDRYLEACAGLRRDPSWTAKYKDWMVEAGFTNVRQEIFRWPVNPWAKNKTLKEIGLWNMLNMLDGLDGFTLRLWTTAFGMTVEEIQIFLVQVRKDLRNTSIHSYWPM